MKLSLDPAIEKIKDLLGLNRYWEDQNKKLLPIKGMTNGHIKNALKLFKDRMDDGAKVKPYRIQMLRALLKEAKVRKMNLKKLGSLDVFYKDPSSKS